MPEQIALYVPTGSSVDGATLLDEIRASDFIDEINSGEGPREECGLYNLIQLVTPADSSIRLHTEAEVLAYHAQLVKGSVKAALDSSWNANCILIADQTQTDIVHILELDHGKVQDRLKAKARSSVEVASNVSISNMTIQEYKDNSGNSEVYDALQ